MHEHWHLLLNNIVDNDETLDRRSRERVAVVQINLHFNLHNYMQCIKYVVQVHEDDFSSLLSATSTYTFKWSTRWSLNYQSTIDTVDNLH